MPGAVLPLVGEGYKALESAERSQLIQYYQHCKAMGGEWLKRQIVQNNRIDILALAVLGYSIEPFHFSLLKFQFQHRESLQLVFRGAGKTTICTITKSIHYLLKNPNLRILLASKTSSNAEAFLKEIKAHFEGNEMLREIFGPYYDANKVTKWDNREIEVLPRTVRTKEASITCVGVEGTVVGKHYDIILGDDLVDEENTRTKYMRDKTKQWYYQTLDPTLEPPSAEVPHRGEYHRMGTRYHYDDLYGYLMANELKEHYQIIPALKNGKSPWPKKYPPEWFAEKKRKSGVIIFNCQYQCHSDDTEFLTKNGWKNWYNIGDDELLATFNMRSGFVEYQKQTGRTCLPTNKNLVRLLSYKVDALVTKNHRMIARPSGWEKRSSPPKGNWELVEAQKLKGIEKDRVLLYSGVTLPGHNLEKFRIPSGKGGREDGRGGVTANHPSKIVSMDDFVEFLGLFVSEGSTTKKSRGGIRVSQNEGKVLDDARRCIRSLGFKFKENNTKGCVAIDFRHIGLWKWLRKNVKTSSHNAKIPRFVFGLSIEQREAFLKSLISGDGYTFKGVKSDCYQYTTVSKQLADDVQELATLACYDTCVSRVAPSVLQRNAGTHGSFRVCIRRSIGNGIKANQIQSEKYVGNVVCFSVPNHTLITRRNGKVLVSGNCDAEAMKGEIFQYDDCQQVDEEDIPDALQIFMGVDLAISQKDTADHFAIVVIGQDSTDRRYVLDYYDGQLRFNAQTAKIIEFYEKWEPIRAAIETNAYQDAQYQSLKDDDKDIRLMPVIQDTDKIARAWKLSALFEDKRMYFKKNMGLLIEQLVLFPNFRYKDLFDALDLAVEASKTKKKKKRRAIEPGLL
jgi:phage terminase large subunit-like protein